ncbi:MAG TPA: glycoside hydrolase family 32 protein [Puia sp.]|nr:glycoside hydrolase family 32 protein [Puia sp.]
MRKYFQLFFSCFFFVSTGVLAQHTISTPQWRPVYHFTPAKNWTNDPNGLIYLNGIYHLYNQQNPFENKWGHMSWGHATTTDMVHWKHLPVAIPEKIGKDTIWIFSGCSVLDKNNSSGFCKNGSCIVAVYTADQPNLKKESQFIAYSNDGGMSFTDYENNPVIDLHKKDFRDPNVLWNEQLHKWLMVVASPRERKVLFYTSDNLKKWDSLSEFGPAGFANGIWECPSFFQLPVQGTNRKKWVLMTSFGGGHKPMMQYFVGDFDGKNFVNDNPADKAMLVDNGDCFYAAISWNNVPGDKKILIGWMVPGEHNTYPWRGQMSIPRDLGLIQTKEGLRLIQQPASLIKNSLPKLSGNDIFSLDNQKVTGKEIVIGQKNTRNAYWLETEIEFHDGAIAGFNIAGKKDAEGNIVSATSIAYDEMKHELYIDKTNSGDDKIKKENLLQSVILPGGTKKIKLEILMDKSSLEIFVNNGEQVLTTYIFPETGADGLSFFAKKGTAEIRNLKLWNLSNLK